VPPVYCRKAMSSWPSGGDRSFCCGWTKNYWYIHTSEYSPKNW